MTGTKKPSINIALMVILIAISIFGNEVSAQESDGAVKSAATGDEFHIASYYKNDKPVTYPVEGQWSDHRDKQPDDRQPSYTGNGSGPQWWKSQDVDDDGTIDAKLNLAFGNSGIDADVFNLGGNTDWHLPNMKNLYASIDLGISLPSFYGGTTSDSATDLIRAQIDRGSGLNWEDSLTWEEEKYNEDEAGFSEWSLRNSAELERILDYSLFPDMASFSGSGTMFDAMSALNATDPNNPTDIDFETDRPFISSTDFSLLSAEQTGQASYWSINYYNDGTAENEMVSANYVNILSIDTQGGFTGIAQKIKELLP